MKRFTLFMLAIGMIYSANAQKTVDNYDADEEMQEQMRLIVNTLGLDVQEVYQLGQIMTEKREAKEAVLAEIDALKLKLDSIELSSQKQIRGIMTDTQWERYQTEVKEKTEEVVKNHMLTLGK